MLLLLKKNGRLSAFIVALTAMLGSLYFSEVALYIPCTLCWYQRILMYPLVLILLVSLIEGDKGVFKYVLPFSVIGLGVSAYHYLLQLGAFGDATGCTIGVPCNARYINWLGFITIPALALTAFILITTISLIARYKTEDELDELSYSEEMAE